MFQDVLDKCPLFYEIGIFMDTFTLPMINDDIALLLGKLNKEVTNLFLPY